MQVDSVFHSDTQFTTMSVEICRSKCQIIFKSISRESENVGGVEKEKNNKNYLCLSKNYFLECFCFYLIILQKMLLIQVLHTPSNLIEATVSYEKKKVKMLEFTLRFIQYLLNQIYLSVLYAVQHSFAYEATTFLRGQKNKYFSWNSYWLNFDQTFYYTRIVRPK